MRSPDLGDPVSLLERRILYFISGTPAIQMHIALSRDQCEARSNLRARGSVGTVAAREISAADIAIRHQGHANLTRLQ
jgi:hypothetical protein